MEEEKAVLVEGRIMDIIRNAASKLSGFFKGDDNTATQVINNMVKTRLMNLQSTVKLSPQDRQIINKINNSLSNTEPPNVLTLDISKEAELDLGVISDLNNRMIEVFGKWWKDHLITQKDFEREIAKFQRNRSPRTDMKIAVPLNNLGNVKH